MDNDQLYENGLTTWHSSEEDGGPDVGLSLGLGGLVSLFVGDMPGKKSWHMALFFKAGGGPLSFAKVTDAEAVREAMDYLASAISFATKEARQSALREAIAIAENAEIPGEFDRDPTDMRGTGFARASDDISDSLRALLEPEQS